MPDVLQGQLVIGEVAAMIEKGREQREIVVDNFAGGGGASTGIEMAIGRSVDVAINHDPAAIAMHRANHPTTRHYTEDVWKVDPVEVCDGRPVALAWFSPDCKHHSKAKGGKPVSKRIRGLAWVAVKWVKQVRPRVIMLENVEEFQDWGRLDENNRPDPRYKGETFRRFVRQLEYWGYRVEYRLLRACDYGAPTIRRRFFLIARCDGKPIIWPEGEYGDPEGIEVAAGIKKPWKPVADVLDFDLPCPSIFETSEEIWKKYGIRAVRPLSEKTMRRIARGIQRYVIDSPQPFIIQYHSEQSEKIRGQQTNCPLMTVDTSNRYGLIEPYLVQSGYGERDGQKPRVLDIGKPLGTVVAQSNKFAMCSAFITQFNNHTDGHPATEPIGTLTAQSNHFGEVRAFLIKYYNAEDNIQPVSKPLATVTAHDRMGLVTVQGQEYQIADIGLRMLTPRELFNAQGFPADYIIDTDADGNPYPKSDQVEKCGNAVCPQIPAALVRANLPEICQKTI